jgi:hypothetical protein
MNRAIIDDARWEEHRPAIDFESHPLISQVLVARTRYYFIFGAASKREIAHRNFIPDAPERRVLMMPEAGHNIVQRLKGSGVLADMVQAMLRQDDAKVDALEQTYLRWAEANPLAAAGDAAV